MNYFFSFDGLRPYAKKHVKNKMQRLRTVTQRKLNIDQPFGCEDFNFLRGLLSAIEVMKQFEVKCFSLYAFLSILQRSRRH